MKFTTFFLPFTCLALSVGCSDSTPKAAPAKADAVTTAPTPPPSGLAAMPGNIKTTKDVVAAVNANAAKADAVSAPDAVTAKVAAVAKDVLPALVEQLKSQAAKSSSANQPKIADLLGGKLGALTSSLSGSQKSLGEGVQGVLDGLIKGDTNSVLDKLGSVVAESVGLSPEQQKLVGEVRNLVAAWLVDKQFTGTGLQDKAGTVVKGLMENDWAQSILGVKNLSQSKDLSAGQKGLLDGLLEKFAPNLKGAGEAINLLKGFGK